LHSPAGEATIAMIGKELAEMAALEDNIQQEVLSEQRLHKRLMAFLLLGLLHRREAHADQLNEEAEQIIHQHAKTEEQTALKRQQAAAALHPHEFVERNIAAYSKAANAMEAMLENRLHESKTLEQALAELELNMLLAGKKYAHYDTHLQEIYQELAKLTLEGPIPPTTIQQRIHALSQQIDLDTDQVSGLLDAGNEDEARDLMEISNARNLQIATLRDMLSVINDQKLMYTPMGMVTKDFQEAAYILAKEHKLVHDNGKYYLLKHGQNFAELSPSERDNSEQAYLRLRPEIMGVKQLVAHNQGVEEKAHNERKTSLSARSDMMQQEILLLANQLTLIQAARADAMGAISEASTTTPGIKLTPLPSAPSPVPHPRASSHVSDTPKYMANSYREILQLMRTNPTQRAIDWLKNSLATTPDPSIQTQLNKLMPGKPINPGLMNMLLARRDLGQLLALTNKPGNEEPELAPSTAPTPFSMKPY
jgi:hypothetical protein